MSRKIMFLNDSFLLPITNYQKDFITKIDETFIENADLNLSRREVYKLSAGNSFVDFDAWSEFIQDNFPVDTSFSNHNTAIPFPKNIAFLSRNEDIKNVPFYRIAENINYQDATGYFEAISNRDERELPCFYTEFKNYTNKDMRSLRMFPNMNLTEDFFKGYHPTYGPTNQRIGRSPTVTRRMSNFLFGSDFNYAINNINKNVFPIYADIKFKTFGSEYFRPIVEELDLYESFVNDCLSAPKQSVTFEVSDTINNTVTRSYDSLSLKDIITNFSFSMDLTNKLVFASEYERDTHFSSNIKKLACLGKLRTLAKDKNRTYIDIQKGVECEYEFMFYEVKKYVGSTTTGIPITSYMCSSKQEVVSIIDTQVKPQQQYTYVVHGRCIIYGSSYKTVSRNFYKEQDNFFCDVVIENSPSFQIIDIPLFIRRVNFSLFPPLPPHAQFLNESDSSNKIKIYLDLNRGELDQRFIQILEEDSDLLPLMNPAQEAGKHTFKYTKEAGNFEFFRMDTKPKNYADFENGVNFMLFNEYNSTSLLYYDYVRPNKKYYYTFRALGGTELLSNPSPIYEVELIKDADGSKVAVNVIHLEKPVLMEGSVSFRRLLRIVPALQQTTFEDTLNNSSYNNSIDNLTLGVASDPIWGKKFKIRLKSKDSGKKLDFNILFNLVKSKSTEDFS